MGASLLALAKSTYYLLETLNKGEGPAGKATVKLVRLFKSEYKDATRTWAEETFNPKTVPFIFTGTATAAVVFEF